MARLRMRSGQRTFREQQIRSLHFWQVTDDTQRIFDLWHGTILSRDCALQLFLIVDCIYDWARDTYRFDILRCLSDGKFDPREMTPAYDISILRTGSELDPRETTQAYGVSSVRTGTKVGRSNRSPDPAESSSRRPAALDPISLISDSESESDFDEMKFFFHKSDSDSDPERGRKRKAFHQEIDSILLDTDDSEDEYMAWIKDQRVDFGLQRLSKFP
jgi:hypothetical protein